MKNKNGFTLPEVLAVISIIGVIAILCIPAMINLFNGSYKRFDDINKDNIKDAARMYMVDLDHSDKTYSFEGVEYKGQELKKYIVDNGINPTITFRELVDLGYYECDFNRNNTCKNIENCPLELNFNITKKSGFYVSDHYDVEIKCE